ncbi:hypothetical protein QQP08_017084 [Theobroma cacao]|nr:hypothetical protein QQP08_017084 [Theobroma cacao]
MDHSYDGFSCITAGAAAAAAISASSAVDASFRSGYDNDSSPFLGLDPIPGAHYHHHCSLKFDSKILIKFLLIFKDYIELDICEGGNQESQDKGGKTSTTRTVIKMELKAVFLYSLDEKD